MIIKKVLYIKKVKKNVFIYKEKIVYPLVEDLEDLLFLSNNRFIEVLNCIQFAGIGSLF